MAEKRIGSDTYRCRPMRATEAIELLADITRVVSISVSQLPNIILHLEEQASGMAGASEMADVATLAALGDILARTPSSDIREMIERIVTKAEIKRPSGYDTVSLDDDFTDSLESIVPVAKFVLEVNYAGFFGASGAFGALKGLRTGLATAK